MDDPNKAALLDLFARLVHPHDAVLGQVPQLGGLHDVDDWEWASTIPGLMLYRYDAPLCFANAEDFRRRAMASLAAEATPVRWFVLNAEAIMEIGINTADVLQDFQRELTANGAIFAMARTKQVLYQQHSRTGFVDRVGPEHFYPTVPEAIAALRGRWCRALGDRDQ